MGAREGPGNHFEAFRGSNLLNMDTVLPRSVELEQGITAQGITVEDEAPGYEPHDVSITFGNKYGGHGTAIQLGGAATSSYSETTEARLC